MTNEKLKTRIQISSSVDKKLWKEFWAFSNKTKVPISKRLDEAMTDILIKYGEKKK